MKKLYIYALTVIILFQTNNCFSAKETPEQKVILSQLVFKKRNALIGLVLVGGTIAAYRAFISYLNSISK